MSFSVGELCPQASHFFSPVSQRLLIGSLCHHCSYACSVGALRVRKLVRPFTPFPICDVGAAEVGHCQYQIWKLHMRRYSTNAAAHYNKSTTIRKKMILSLQKFITCDKFERGLCRLLLDLATNIPLKSIQRNLLRAYNKDSDGKKTTILKTGNLTAFVTVRKTAVNNGTARRIAAMNGNDPTAGRSS